MKNNPFKPVEKTYIIQEQPVKQSNLSAAAKSKVVNHNQPYQSQNQENYGPCIPFNQNCECTAEQLKRQVRRLENDLQNERDNSQFLREIFQVNQAPQQVNDELNAGRRSLRVNSLVDLPAIPEGTNLQQLINNYNNFQQIPTNWQQQITNLNNQLTERDNQIRGLNQQISNLQSQVNQARYYQRQSISFDSNLQRETLRKIWNEGHVAGIAWNSYRMSEEEINLSHQCQRRNSREIMDWRPTNNPYCGEKERQAWEEGFNAGATESHWRQLGGNPSSFFSPY